MAVVRQKEGTHTVRVFLASPGSDEQERQVFRKVIHEVNTMRGDAYGVVYKPVETLFSRFRPQSLLKKDVLSSEVVVAPLGQAWDEQASRFEVAYSWASAYHKEVWCYFRVLQDNQLITPDSSLSHVLDFRDQVEQAQGARYHYIENPGDWERQLYTHLSLWLDNIATSSKTKVHSNIAEPSAGYAAESSSALDLVREAWTYARQGRYTRARTHFAQAVHQASIPPVMLEYARFLEQMGFMRSAESYFEIAARIAESKGQSSSRALALRGLGNVYITQGLIENAEDAYTHALEINEQLGLMEEIARDYSKLGHVYWLQDDFKKAEHAYHHAVEINTFMGRDDNLAEDYGSLGNVYGMAQRLQDAADMFSKALNLYETQGCEEGVADQYSNLGIVYRVQGQLGKAEEMYLKALEVHSALGQKQEMATDYSNLGNVYQEQGRLFVAEQMYLKALALNELLGDWDALATQFANLALVYQAQGKWEKAEQMYRRCLSVFEVVGDESTIERVQAWLSDLEEQIREHGQTR